MKTISVRSTAVFAAWLLAVQFFLIPAHAQDLPTELVNGNFEKWNSSGPAGWTVEVGANNGGNVPLSIVRKGEGPSLELTGEASTMAWNSVSQSIAVQKGDTFRIKYSVKTTDMRREGGQYDNCFVGVFQKNKRGEFVSRSFWQNNVTEYVDVAKIFRIVPNATEAQVVIFLSKTGTLNVRDVSVERLKLEDSFDVLVADMDLNYSFFEHKQIDWRELTGRYRQAAVAAKSPAAFSDVIAGMLFELQDVHTWVAVDNQRKSKFVSSFDANFDFRHVDSKLKSKKQIGKFGLVGVTDDGFGYVRIDTLSDVDQATFEKMIGETENLFDAPGMIVDLRHNNGGAEPVAQQFASLFADEVRVYARQKFRAGADHSSYYETAPRQIGPRENGKTYTRPIICLIGPGAISSGEGMALMFGSLPHCTLIGQPTRGASGNPDVVPLPNGVDVWYSRWVSMTPDGDSIEGVGVHPDVLVEHGKGEPTFERALEELEKLIQ